MVSDLFRSIGSAFQPPRKAVPTSSPLHKHDPLVHDVDTEALLQLLVLFRPTNVADVFVVAAHYARVERWELVTATYKQLEDALSQRCDHLCNASLPASNAYSPLVERLSPIESSGWLTALRQCQHDVQMLQPGHTSLHSSDEHTKGVLDGRSQQQQQQHLSADGGLGASADSTVDSTQGQSEEGKDAGQPSTGDTAASARQRKRKKSHKKRAKSEWGEIAVPAKKRRKRSARHASKAPDEQQTAGAVHKVVENSAEVQEGESQMRDHKENAPSHANIDDESAADESMLEHELDEGCGISRLVDPRAEAVQEADKQVDAAHESESVAEAAMRSRWKRPCKRLVRFRVVVGEEEQDQIAAQQEAYMKLSGYAQPSPAEQSHAGTTSTDNPPQLMIDSGDSMGDQAIVFASSIETAPNQSALVALSESTEAFSSAGTLNSNLPFSARPSSPSKVDPAPLPASTRSLSPEQDCHLPRVAEELREEKSL